MGKQYHELHNLDVNVSGPEKIAKTALSVFQAASSSLPWRQKIDMIF